MILALGASGREFDSPQPPSLFLLFVFFVALFSVLGFGRLLCGVVWNLRN